MSFFLSPLPLPGRGRLRHYRAALGLSLVAEETLSHLPWGSPAAWLLCQLAPHPLTACSEHGDRENVSACAQAAPPTDLAAAENMGDLAGLSCTPGGFLWPQPHPTTPSKVRGIAWSSPLY